MNPEHTLRTPLTEDDLRLLRDVYRATDGWAALKGRMQSTLPNIYPLAEGFVDSIMAALYGDLPPENGGERAQLSVADRERCIVAVLAARGADFNLALHMYIALMEGISPSEIAHILLLSGVYTGVDNFTNALGAAVKLFVRLAKAAAEARQGDPMVSLTADKMFECIKETFELAVARG